MMTVAQYAVMLGYKPKIQKRDGRWGVWQGPCFLIPARSFEGARKALLTFSAWVMRGEI